MKSFTLIAVLLSVLILVHNKTCQDYANAQQEITKNCKNEVSKCSFDFECSEESYEIGKDLASALGICGSNPSSAFPEGRVRTALSSSKNANYKKLTSCLFKDFIQKSFSELLFLN
jgi:hypothetical protein